MNDHILGRNNSGFPFRVEIDDGGLDLWLIWDMREGLCRPVKLGIPDIDEAFRECRRLNRQEQGLPRYEVIRDWQADAPMHDNDEHWSVIDTWDPWDGDKRVKIFRKKSNATRFCAKLNGE